MITAISWVPKGIAKLIPEVAEPPSQDVLDQLKNDGPSVDEINEAIESGAFDRSGDSGDEEDDGEMDVEDSKQSDEVAHALAVAEALGKTANKSDSGSKSDGIANALKELNMDNYDDEDDGIELFSKGLGDLYYPSNEMDPYLKEKDDDDSEEEDLTIKPTDSVIVCAHTEDDFSHLQVCIFEQSQDGETNLYVHHEIVISAFPLCTAWLDCPLKGGDRGNFLAVGSMEPSIEIWDLDIIDEVEPCAVLGGVAEKEKKKKTKKISVKYKEGSHTDSVLGLAWNKEFRNLLASASADKQVKIWDAATGQCNITLEHHTDKVQAVAWNHHSPHVLLSGSFDRSVVMKDGRNPSHSGYKWPIAADVESLAWDPHNEQSFVVSLENGMVQGFDIRSATSDLLSTPKPSFTIHAHEKAVCTLAYNTAAPNLLATGSSDKVIKLWDLSNNQPSCVASQNLRAGAVFSLSFSEDNPFSLAVGGSKGRLQVWDILSDEGIARKYEKYRKQNKS